MAASPSDSTAPSAVPLKESSGRFISVDALRGLDMTWIVGASYLVSALGQWSGSPVLSAIKSQLSHVAWEGFRFYDLIFPLFVFIVGVSTVFSLRRLKEKSGVAAALRRVVVRGVVLFLVGLFYSGGLSHSWPDLRVLGVLNRIALAYTGAGILFLLLPRRLLPVALLTLLLGYWAMMKYVHIRDIRLDDEHVAALQASSGETNLHRLFASVTKTTSGHFDPGYNVVNHFDFQYLPGKLYDKYYDPEGILSTIPAIGTCLLGVLAGLLLTRTDLAPTGKSVRLVVGGLLLFGLGWLWGQDFPVVKKLWTSSFVCVAGGCSLVLLGIFHQLIDVWGLEFWFRPFIWVGSNALTIYIGAQLLNYRKVADRFVGGDVKVALGNFGEVLLAVTSLLIIFGIARFLYRRKVFLRV
jgi:predicted acyltransferase